MPVDGRAEPSLIKALRDFQTSHHLTATGKPDAATMSVLRRRPTRDALSSEPQGVPSPPGKPLALGDSGAFVRSWQSQMRSRGFVDVAVDGVYGDISATSCKWLQVYLGAVPTGQVDGDLWRSTWVAP